MALDTLEVFGTEYTNVAGFKATDENNQTKTYIRPQGTISISSNGTGIDVSTYATADVSVSAPSPTLQTKTKTYTPTESVQTETVTADAGYDGIDEVGVTVNAISSTYVGSGITQRTSSDLSAIGATVTAPAGYYASAATKTISSGSATPPTTISGSSATLSTGTNTITLQKTVSVTPQVSAGYVSAGTAGNTLVSLNANVTTQGATTYHPSTSNQTINGSRYLTGNQTINAVTTTNLTADNIKSGVVVQVGDSSDSDCVTSVTGTYTGGGGMNKQIYYGPANVKNNGYTASSATLTVAKTGTYKVSWTAWRSSSQGTMGTNLYKNSTAGTNQQTFTGTYGQCITLTNQSYTAGDVLTIYATSGSTSRTIYIANFIIEQTS